ncbi:hypothetical protein [Cohnella thailandensis]|uniref:Copper amine oxidase-like N-terminal domain-containing protein n=1 Tax=Cohnella thailandensis TaxID=557557 RepID=A0A841T4Q0_9BACL|nr:hypothetical protein [Cohnella thailandensis]MBB6637826.1 hypothetical protein [Cohnella thailandensis]MBP1973994.1 hypothetical protein [Cohnella thailandensis]
MKTMMKKSVFGVVVLGMTVAWAGGVYAGSNLQKITAYLNGNLDIQVNGTHFTAKDGNGNKLSPITYENTTYLPVRAVADAVNVPIVYDASKQQIRIGTGTTAPSTGDLSDISYTAAQVKAIKAAFAGFDGFETAYAPTKMTQGDAYQKAVGTSDGVNLVFDHMIVNVSPRDYSAGYESQEVTLSNGVKAKWYTPSDTAMLSFQLDDRTVTISSPDSKASKAMIEKVAVSVSKLQ